MSDIINVSRRNFVKTGLSLSGGLILGFHLSFPNRAYADPTTFKPNAFIRIGSDDSVTFMFHKTEMGQGVYTSIPMLIAEELEVDLSKVKLETAPVDPVYNNPIFKMQMTGGSTSVVSCWEPLREAGAAARLMLIQAAAQVWGVATSSCQSANGVVQHAPSKRRLSYGDLAESASRLRPPEDVLLKPQKEFKIIGKPTTRFDNPAKATGAALFGIDAQVPGMLVAVISRAPVFGATLKNFNPAKAKAVLGVKAVVQIDAGVAVVANSFWHAKKGRDALQVTWDEGPLTNFNNAVQREQYTELLKHPGALSRKQGDVATGLSAAAKKIEVVYEVPYLAHATMEPMNCLADVRQDNCEIWVGTQFQTLDVNAAAKAADLSPGQVKLHSMFAGGGFGRRGSPDADFVREAVQTSKAVKAPVKVMWTREDDMQGGYYRPSSLHAMTGGVDGNGAIVAWSHKIVGQSVLLGGPFEFLVKDEGQVDSVAGATDLPYEIPNFQVDVRTPRTGPKVWAWRAVGSSHNGFVVECFLEELAEAARKDPYEFRRTLMNKHPRHKSVLELVAEKAGWGTPLPAGKGRGIAIHDFGSVVAQVAEVTVSNEGDIKIDRVVCAIDCGTTVNPKTVEAQMEGGIIFGLSAALYGEITFEKGRPQQSNFHNYQIMRIDAAPLIEVHIVPSSDPPQGVGEAGVPPIAAALVNAIFSATGKRIRQLPIRSESLKRG
jgi:isoquinoline 1-oxidoreductase beta subunit